MQHPEIFILKFQTAANGEPLRPALRRGVLWLWLAASFFLSVASGFAASITWDTVAIISGDADVNSSGTPLYACARGITTASTNVNGVTFTAATGNTTWGNVSFNASFNGNTANLFASNAVPFSGLSSAYKTVLQGGTYGGAATGTVTLNGLTYGRSYSVQIWANDSRGGALATRTETVTSGNTVTLAYDVIQTGGGVGQYVVGTFVANSTSQAFTLTSSSSVQLNAIQVRDNGYVGIQSVYTPSRFNLAKYQPVFTDSTNGTQTSAYLSAGFVNDNNCWVSDSSGAHWAGVVFPFPVTVGSAQLAMGLNNASPMTVFYFQYLTNGNWVTVPGSTVVGNTNVERNIVFSAPITSTSFRVYDSIDSPIRIRQLALYPPNGTNGYPFGTDFSIDLARKQPAFATANTFGNWPLLAADGLISPSSAWQTTLVGSNSLLINLQFTNKIGSAHLYSGATGVAPLTNFVLQYWTAGAWANIPGGSVTGNSSSALVIPFTTPVTTTKVQLVFTNSGTSAVQELCIFPANSNGGYPLGTGMISNTPVTAKYDTYSDSYYYLSNSAAAQVIEESNGVPVLGAAVVTNWAAQYQVLLNYDNGTYRLINRDSGLCLAGAQMATNAGAALVDENYSALPDQDWYLQSVDGVSFYFLNQFSGLALDAAGGVLVQNVMSNSTSQYWQISLAQIFPKKGIAGASNGARVTFDANWCYGWWYTTSAVFPTNFHYFPMDPDSWYRGSTVAGNLLGFQPGWRTTGYSLNVLGYNEPDHTDQANLDATNGAIYWMNDQNLDLPLVGPAAADVNGTWNKTFYGYITNWGCRVDYLPAHEYPGNSSSASSSIWINPMQTAYNTYGYPIWMTEWSVVDWGGTGNWSEEDNYNALAEFLWRAESIPWLRKYCLFVFGADANSPMAVNPWTRTTPAPRSNSLDTDGVLTPFGELYAAWDCDATVKTNKVYYLHNSGTRKRLANTGALNAESILLNDPSDKWTLVSAGSANLYYLVSAVDGRRLSYNGSSTSLVASGTTGTAVQWSLTGTSQTGYGWYYLDHPATSKRLSLAYNNSTFVATYSMVANTTTSTAVQWRFIVPTQGPAVWTGVTNTFWATPGNWYPGPGNWNPGGAPTAGQGVRFNNLSTANLATVLNADFSLYYIAIANPPGPVFIGGTNTLTIANGINLSAATQDLTITAPIVLGNSQNWTVASGQTLSVNGGVSGNGGLTIVGSGTVFLGGTNTYSGTTTVSGGELDINNWGAATLGAITVGDTATTATLGIFGGTLALGSSTFYVGNGSSSAYVGIVNQTGGTVSFTGGAALLLGNGSNGVAGTYNLSGGTLSSGAYSANNRGVILGVNTGCAGTFNLSGTGVLSLPLAELAVGRNDNTSAVSNCVVAYNQNGGIATVGYLSIGGQSLSPGTTSTFNIMNGMFVANNFQNFVAATNNSATLYLGGGAQVTLPAFPATTGTANITFDFTNGYLSPLVASASYMPAGIFDNAYLTTNGVNFNIANANSITVGQVLQNAASQAGTLTKSGLGTLTLASSNTYTGGTTISAGTLALSGSGSLSSGRIVVAGGATFSVSGRSTPFALGSNRVLTNSSVGAVLNGTNNCTVGTLSLFADGANPAFVQTNGTMTISASTVIKVNNTGATLASGIHPLIAAATTGNLGKVVGALPALTVTGNGAVAAVSLQFNGSSGLDLMVASTISSASTNLNFTFNNGVLTLTWPGDHLGWIAQSNSVNLADTNYWFDILGSESATNLNIPVSPATPQVFYRIRYPF